MSGYYDIVVYGLVILIVAVIILAEIVQLYRSKSVGSLYNKYILAFIIAFLLFLLRLTIMQVKSRTPIYLIVFYLVVVDYLGQCLFFVYFWLRGILIVVDTFGIRNYFEIKIPHTERLKMCKLCMWAFGIYAIIVRAGPFVVIWLIDVFGN